MQELDYIPPHNLDAEQTVLANFLSLSMDDSRRMEVFQRLKPNQFYKKIHQEIFKALQALDARSENIDYITLANELEGNRIYEDMGGKSYLDKLTAVIPRANVISYVEIIAQKAKARHLISICKDLLEKSYSGEEDTKELVELAEKKVFEIAQFSEEAGYQAAGKFATEAFDMIAEVFEDKDGKVVPGVATGFKDLDKLTLGFKPGDMVILGARPSMGKTAFCLQIAKNVAVDRREATVIYSLEMPGTQLVTRLFSNLARINGMNLLSGKIRTEEANRLTRAVMELQQSPLFINDKSGMTLYEIRNDVRRLARELSQEGKTLSMIVIDYLQLIGSSEKYSSEQVKISDFSRGVKNLAREFKVPVICLSQLSRKVEDRADKRPMLSDLRESGAIEQDADQVLFLHRPEYYSPENAEEKGVAEVILAKNRNGPTGSVKLHFDRNNACFQDLYVEA